MSSNEQRPKPRLSARDIQKSYFGNPALQNVDLDLWGGEMLALVGANGAGKSTLVKIICGAETLDVGTVLIDGKPTSVRSVGDALAAGIAVAHQQVAVISSLTAAENVMLGREPLRGGFIRQGALRAQAEEFVRRFGIDINLDVDCSELGLGENKIIDILKALVTEPAILILDEPTASLTLAESRNLFSFLADLKQHGLAILFISHHLDEIFEHCDRVAVLRDGRKVHDGPVKETDLHEVVLKMVGRNIEELKHEDSAVRDTVVAKLNDVSIEGLHVPELLVHAGEIVGIAGVLGAGQTELLEVIAGAGQPAHGQFMLNGEQGRPTSVKDAVSRRIYLVADDRQRKSIFPGLTIEENLLVGSLDQASKNGFMQTDRVKKLANRAVTQLKIKCQGIEQDILQLSGGNQQKVVFGRWVIRISERDSKTHPMLLLDNPTEGVDVGSKAEIYELIQELVNSGASVVITSAEFAEMLKLCDRIYCIADKKLRTCLQRSEFSEARILLEVN